EVRDRSPGDPIAFPALGNNLVSLVKNSSLVSTIGMVELMFVANDIAFNNFRTFEIYGAAALLYVLLALALTRALHLAERRMARARLAPASFSRASRTS